MNWKSRKIDPIKSCVNMKKSREKKRSNQIELCTPLIISIADCFSIAIRVLTRALADINEHRLGLG